MTYERQPEQDAPHAAADALTGNSSWSRKIVYNGFNLVSQVTDARGVATNFTYDTLNRLTYKAYSDGSPTVEQRYDEVRYPDGGGETYSNRGRLTTVISGASGTVYQEFNYNRMGKVAMHRQAVGGNAFEIQYTYNPGGQLIEEWVRGERQQLPPNYLWTYTLDEKRSYFYDAAGRLTGVNRGSHSAPQAAYASALSYNAAGALESMTYGSGATETMSYNSRLQTSSQSLVKAGVVLQRYDYQYGQVNPATGAVDAQKNNGQLGRTDAFIGGSPASPTKQWEERFSYDSKGRLNLASEYRGDNASLTWQAGYDHDWYGNRMQFSSQNTNLSYIPVQSSDINPLTNRFTANVSYDAAGQTLTDAKFRGLQYQYDADGRMKWSANLDGSNPATSVFDGLGQRVQTTQAGVTKSYFYDINGSVVAEYEATGGTGYRVLKRLNVCAGGKLLAVDEVQTDGSKVTSSLMADRQGSTRVLMNAAGVVTSRHDYFPFGEELGAGTGAPGSPTGMRTAAQGYSAADNVRQRYADTRLDDATGLDHTLWRKLETRSGRWTTPDPYGRSMKALDPQSFNRYAHVNNDPVNFVDPTGLNLASPGLSIGSGYCWFVSWINDGQSTFVGGHCMADPGGGGLGDGDTGEGDPYDPRADFRDYAKQLLNDKSKSDCGKLALMIYKAGQVAGGDAGRTVSTLLNGLTEWSSVTGTTHSDPNFRVGAVPPSAGGFGDSGFSKQFQDDSNQVRHFTFYLAAGYSIGIPAALAGLYANEGTFSSSNPDVALGQVAASLGGNFFGDYRALAQDVWHQVCGQSGDLSLP